MNTDGVEEDIDVRINGENNDTEEICVELVDKTAGTDNVVGDEFYGIDAAIEEDNCFSDFLILQGIRSSLVSIWELGEHFLMTYLSDSALDKIFCWLGHQDEEQDGRESKDPCHCERDRRKV